MLNFIYYPVSGIMWVWHWLFHAITPSSPGWDGIAWALSVVFLVFTLRVILYKPFVKQIRTTKKMQEINPQMQAIRKKYKNDRVKMTEEMQKLQKEHGFNPLLGCLPMFMQIPVFIGLFHVLRSFNRMGTSFGQQGMTAAETRTTPNYFFSAEQVQNFLDARLFGVPLSSYIVEPVKEFQAFVEPGSAIDFERWQIAAVAVPLVILSGIATHMNARASVSRQTPEAMENPQTRIMNKLALYIFPLGIVVTGAFFPLAILLYWVSNNAWTYGQQHIVFGRIAREEEEAKAAKQEKLKSSAPKPGARPVRSKQSTAVIDAKADEAADATEVVDLSKTASSADTQQADTEQVGTQQVGTGAAKTQQNNQSAAARSAKPGGARQAGSKRNKKKRKGGR